MPAFWNKNKKYILYELARFDSQILLLVMISLCLTCNKAVDGEPKAKHKFEISKTSLEWKKQLSPEVYEVMREKGTERPFTNDYHSLKDRGTFVCAACGNKLFDSETKFDSGTGWPSFYKPANNLSVEEETDTSWGMTRSEVICKRCGGHLGHVFPDGPAPTGLRYCINSVSLKFEKLQSPKER